MIKICYIIQSLHIGGTETFIYSTAKHLKNQFEFHFIATGNPTIHPKFHKIGKAVYLGEKWNKIIEYLRENNIDILQYGNLPQYKECGLKAKVPVIIERVAGPRSLKNDHAGISHVVSSSRGIIPAIKKQYSGPLSVIHNGIDINKKVAPKHLFSKDDFVVIYPCSRLGRGQRADDLIKAVINAKNINPKIKLIITGDRPNQAGYEKIKPELLKLAKPLKSDCVFTGFVDNVPELIAGSNLCVIPATTHGISNGLIESCGLKKPIISSNVGQASEICHHGKNGYLFRLGDINQLSKYILYLSKNLPLCKSFGEYGLRLVKKEFNISPQAQEYKKLYLSLCNQI